MFWDWEPGPVKISIGVIVTISVAHYSKEYLLKAMSLPPPLQQVLPSRSFSYRFCLNYLIARSRFHKYIFLTFYTIFFFFNLY